MSELGKGVVGLGREALVRLESARQEGAESGNVPEGGAVGRVSQDTLDWERMFHNEREVVRCAKYQFEKHGRILTARELVRARIEIFTRYPDIENWRHAGIY